MELKVIEKLRRNQSLRTLPDGSEAVDVTLQFVGSVPPAPRQQRKEWLRDWFSSVEQRVGGEKLGIKPESLSVSAQTVEATVPLDRIDDLREELSRENLRLDIMIPTQVIDPSGG